MTSIGDGAFYECDELTSVVIPDSVTRIGGYAFTDCPKLKNAVLNVDRLESIDDHAFDSIAILSRYPCDPGPCGGACGENLTWTLDAEGTLTISGSGDMENWELGERYDKRFNNGWLDAYYLHCTSRFCKNRAIRRVVIRDGVTSIGDCAFVACRNLREVIIPDSVTSIGASAFEDCSILAEVRLPDSVTSIGASAFEHCRILAEIRLPDSVTHIGDRAFAGCYDLRDVTFPDHLTGIDESVFWSCNKLPDMAYYCGHNIYRGACGENLTWTLDATGTLTISGTGDMKNWLHVEGLDGFEVFPETQDKWRHCIIATYSPFTNLDNGSLQAACFRNDEYGTSPFFVNGKIRRVVVEAGVTSIGDNAFWGCENLREVEIANSVKRIGTGAFSVCNALTSINLPEGVKSIGEKAFSNCLRLEEAMISTGVTEIREEAFRFCIQLRSVTIPESVVSIGSTAFQGCGSLYRGYNILYIRCAAGSYADRWAREHHRKVVRI